MPESAIPRLYQACFAFGLMVVIRNFVVAVSFITIGA
jgi:hypothetical protein